MRKRWLTLVVLFIAAATVAFATDFAVIVHSSNPVRAISLVELGKIFKGKTHMWPSERSITIVLRDPDSPGMKFVIEKILGSTLEEGKTILNDPSRRATVPVVFVTSDEEVIKIVESSPGAIGVVDVYNITSGVKVIKIDDKQPFDPGYILKGH
ncbi:MAG TPA: substrate-binding domain-containing protein [Candidatus Sulfotelmatobacter sp.]|jgi:ABC-type phosphate transport system substrate-binding protein|nr:substrate-binding domain-containing protein [Candidatus Sulfotelmatobacter sp.]